MEQTQIIESTNKKTKEKKTINWWKVLEYSMPAIFAICFYVLAMVIRGVYPFGPNSIGYIDYNDGLVPAYTSLWDVFHGTSNFFVDWNLGAGGAVYASFISNSFLSPLSWLIAIFSREQIVFGIAFLVLVKLALMATTAYYCFKKYFPNVNKWILLMFSLVWTFSGWTMVHMTNIGWLDIMILLPLLMISAKKLIEEGKSFWFVIILSYMLMLSYYISYMLLVGIVVVATVYVCTIANNKKKVASTLFFAIIISILISMVAFIPSCITSLQAHRFANVEGGGRIELIEMFFSKTSTIIMYSVPFVFFVRLLLTYKKDKNNVLFFMISFIFLIAGLFIEPINKMWHTGSYFSFPYRYSFVIIMFMIFASLYYINKYFYTEQETPTEPTPIDQPTNKKLINWNNSLLIAFIFNFLFIVLICAIVGMKIIPYQETKFTQFAPYLLLFVITYLLIEFALRNKNKKLNLGKLRGAIIIVVVCLVQCFSLLVGYVSAGSSSNISRVTNAFEINTSKLEQGYKLKDKDAIYNYNFPYLTKYPSLSTWIHISSEEQFQGHSKLGFNSLSTILLSSGGTMMSDALTGNKYVLSLETLSDKYYSLLDSFDYVVQNNGKPETLTTYLYEYKFDINKAYTTNVDLGKLLSDKTDRLEIQNILFKSLYNQTEDIVTSTTFTITETKEQFIITISTTEGQSVIANNDGEIFITEVNGIQKKFGIGLLDFGIATSDTLELKIEKSDNKTITTDDLAKLKFACFDNDKFISAHSSLQTNEVDLEIAGTSINISVNNTLGHKYVFIPNINLKNMQGTLNGEDVKVQSAIDGFMMIELEEGENKITLNHQPQLFKICLIITLVAIVIFAIFSVLNWKFNLANRKAIIWIGFIGACTILLAVGFLVYLKPLFNFFKILILG